MTARANPPIPFRPDDNVVRWRDCLHCKGRGWFLIEPFRTGGGGAGGLDNMTQCQTCKAEYERHRAQTRGER